MERLAEFGTMLGSAIEWVGGVQNVLIGFGALAALPFIAAIASILGALVPLATALGSLALALGAASPIGIAVLAFVGLAAALMAGWEPVVGFFTNLWNAVTGIFSAAWARISPIVEAIAGAISSVTNLLPATGPISALVTGASPTGAVAAPEAQAARRVNQRGRGVQPIEGFNEAAPGLPGALPRAADIAPTLAPPQQGQVTVDVNINGLPPGSRAEATSEGNLVRPPSTSVGYALGRAPR
jgi:hypothetical protein